MTKRTKAFTIGMAALAVAALLVCGVLWALSSVATYDRNWSECMRGMSHGTYYFPSDSYDEASRKCEKQAAPGWPEPAKQVNHEYDGG